MRARDKKEEKERHAETHSDDGWPLEFQRAGNHAEASVYRPPLRNFCLQVGEKRANARARARTRADDDDEFK